MPDDAKAAAALVEQLKAVQKDLSDKLARLNEAKKKDIWDKLGSLGGILVAIIGAIFSYIYQDHQSKQDAILKGQQTHLQQIQTVAPFMTYLTGTDDKARTVALFEVKDLLSPEVAVTLAMNVNSAASAGGHKGPDQGVANFLRGVQHDANTPSQYRQLARTALSQVCGTERWLIKTASDPGASAVLAKENAPLAESVEKLAALPRPNAVGPAGDTRVAPPEETVYSVQANMIAVKHELDGDYHIVLQGQSSKMVAEIPSPDCYSGDNPDVASSFQAARQVVDSIKPSSIPGAALKPPVAVTVTGIGFFDLVHGQTGMAPNGLELHPVLQIVAADH